MKKSIVLVFLLLAFRICLPAQLWTSVQGGCTGNVFDFLPDTTSNILYVVGSFHSAGGTEVWSTATFDGTNWAPIGGGTGDTLNEYWSPPVMSIERFHGDLFVGGGMGYMEGDRSIKFLSRWDGTKWNACGNPTTTAHVTVTNGRLFAMGAFDSIGGKPIKYLASWENEEWEPFGDQLQLSFGSTFTCSEFYKGEYYFAGNFNHSSGIAEIIRWDGTQWKGLGTGIAGDPWINDITVYKGQLFVGGEFNSSSGNPSSFVMAWDGNQWYDPFPNVKYTTQVQKVEIIDDELYIIGNHYVWDDGAWHGLYNLARYNGRNFCSFGGKYLWTTTIAGFQNELYVGTGQILNPFGADSLFPNGRDTVNFIAKWMGGDSVDICTTQPVRITDAVNALPTITLFPNPAHESFTLSIPVTSGPTEISIHDATGRQVLDTRKYKGEAIDVSALSDGLYFVRVNAKSWTQSLKLAKE